LNDQAQPRNFGLLRESRDGGEGNTFYPSDKALRDEMKAWLKTAFAKAVDHQLDLAILLHLNSHGDVQRWRNDFDFDPMNPVAGTTYEAALVQPVLEALEESVPADWPIQISLQGEMGRTVFTHPGSWLAILKRTKERGKLQKAIYGLSFNHEAVSGHVTPDGPKRDTLQQLWVACDFIGVSLYQKIEVSPTSEGFAFNLGRFVGEFSGLGSPLPETKPLHIVEFGVGGGGLSLDGSIQTPAKTVEDAARAPYLGTDKVSENPWTNPGMIDFRRRAYVAFARFLERPLSRHPVQAAYLWSFGSWDVHGLSIPAFGDEEIIRQLKDHNTNGSLSDP
jgi:hypothetical protein